MYINRIYFISALLISTMFGCSNNNQNKLPIDKKLFVLLPSDSTGIYFKNKLTTSDSVNIFRYENMYNGGGVGIGDINNDGLPDIFLVGNMVSSRLYLNKGNFKFLDITESAGINTKGWGSGVAMVDINQDGFLDIYLCISGFDSVETNTNQLFINNGDKTFVESSVAYGLDESGQSIQAAFFDYDNDQDLDMYLVRGGGYERSPIIPVPINRSGSSLNTDMLFRNNGEQGNGHPVFSNVSKEAGITIEGYGLGVSIVDLNEDGWQDIYVSNDYMSSDLLYINTKKGGFIESSRQYFKQLSLFAMGNDVGDINNDGFLDIMSVDMLPEDYFRRKMMIGAMSYNKFIFSLKQEYGPQFMRNMLQLNNGNGTFSEIGRFAGVYKSDWSWAVLFCDLDNDTYQDIFITNGFGKDITDADFATFRANILKSKLDQRAKQRILIDSLNVRPGIKLPNYSYKNNGDLTFTKTTKEWGFDRASYSNGAAYGDLDLDGDLDIVVNNIDEFAYVYRNQLEALDDQQTQYLQIKLQGNEPNRNGLGSNIKIWYDGGKIQVRNLSTQRGFISTVDNLIHFGLGKQNVIDSILITWPDGKVNYRKKIKTGQTLVVNQADALSSNFRQSNSTDKVLFSEVSDQYGIDFVHEENHFIDFDHDFLIPYMYSKNGPGLAVGDIDRNGLEDFFIGGSSQHSGKLFYQNANGRFVVKETGVEEANSEDMGSLLFDADNDNDLDLYVVSGGSEFTKGHKRYQDRIYLNDGRGNFKLANGIIPEMLSSGSCVTAADYDQDGDLDLFVGGRLVPGFYPLSAQSYILRNDGGTFSDVTKEIAPDLLNVGLVTSALWTDYNNDNQIDLLIVGEWMPISVFKNENGKFENTTASLGLDSSTGWWNSLASGDYDNDGDIDYVVGNLGLNTAYNATFHYPMSVTYKDFDLNGSLDPILAYYDNGQNYPAHTRNEFLKQFPGLKRNFLLHKDWALAQMDDILSGKTLNGAEVLYARSFASVYLENINGSEFRVTPLPNQAQLGPVFGMMSEDFTNDGNLDILLTGNSNSGNISTGYNDALIGLLMVGDGRGNFEPISSKRSGIFIDGDCRALGWLFGKDKNPLILALRNSTYPKIYTMNNKLKEFINIAPLDAYAEVQFQNGKSRKVEFYYGRPYLSQSSRALMLSPQVVSVTVYNYNGIQTKIVNSEMFN